MNEEALRALIRESIARHLTPVFEVEPERVAEVPVTFLGHASHYRYSVPKSGDSCVIEPNVTCNHCGYCESHGH